MNKFFVSNKFAENNVT